MTASTLNIYIIGGFLLLNLIIGLWAGRGVKDIRDYALANKSYGIGILTITFLATFFDAYTVIRNQEIIFQDGLIAAYPLLTASISFICLAYWIAPKIKRFTKCLTIGDVMSELYGELGGQIASIISSVFVIGLVCVQILAFGKISENLIGWDSRLVAIIGGSIMVLYSAFGGVKAVTITDILQLLVFIIVVPIIAIVAINKAGGLQEILTSIPKEKITIFAHPKIEYYTYSFVAWLLPMYIASPPIFHRLLMVSNKQKASDLLNLSSVFILCVGVIILFICLAVLKLNPNEQIVPGIGFVYVIKSYFSPVMQSLSLVAMLAIMMSTIDSFLNSGGILIARNVINPVLKKLKITINDINLVKLCTLTLGLIGILLAIQGYEIRAIYVWSVSLSLPMITTPLIAGILGLKTDFKSFISSVIITIPACIIIKLFMFNSQGNGFKSIIIFIINLIAYFTAHIIQNKGIVIRKNKYEEIHWVPSLEGFKNSILGITKIHIRINNYLLNQFYAYKPQYVALAFTVCISYMFPYFSSKNEGGYTIEIIKLIGACFCVALMLKPLWNQWFIKRLHLIWHFILFYCLPFTNTLLFLINQGETPYLVNLVVTVILISYFVDVKSFLFMNILGAYLAYIIAEILIEEVIFSYETIIAMICTYMGGGVVGLIFAYNKQKDLQLVKLQNMSLKFREKYKNETLYDSMNAEDKISKALGSENLRLSESLNEVTASMREMIHKVKRGESTYLHNNMDFEKFDKEVSTLDLVNHHIQELANRSHHYLQLDVKPLDIQEFIDSMDDTAAMFIAGDYSIISHSKENRLKCDNSSIMILFYNILEEINKHNVTNNDIIIDFSDTELSYKLSFLPEYEKKIKALRIIVTTALDTYPSLYKEKYISELLSPRDIKPISNQELPKTESARILAAHYGVTETIDSLEDGYTVIYVIPIDLREVRPAPVDIKSIGRIINMWPKSKELEDQLRDKIAEKAPEVDIKKINKAIDIIKDYHNGQNRKSGEPFYLHPVEVAKILLEYSQNENLILAALLHDTLEDTSLHPMDIKTIFGIRVAELVLGVTKIDFKGVPRNLSEEENIKYLQKADKDVMMIKLSDRIHNMRTIDSHDKEAKRRAIAQETLDFFVPMAKNLGLMKVHDELKTMSEKVLHIR